MKKIVVLALALVLCSVAFVGCSSSSTSAENTEAVGTSAAAADTSAATESVATSETDTVKTIVLVNPLIGNTWWGTVEKGFWR